MKKTMLALTAALLLALPAACVHHGHRGGPGSARCPKHQGCECACCQPDCKKQADCAKNADCPTPTDCPKHQAPAAPAR